MTVRPLALWLAALVSVATLAAVSPAVAAAQAGDEADTTETETPAGEETGVAAQEQDNDDDAVVAVGVLVFGALALAMTLLYLNAWRRSSAELIKHTLAATGQLPDYEFVAAALPDETARDLEAPVPLSIRGPALVHVGRGARFRALQGGEAVQVEWAVDPAESGRAEPSAGDRTTVTPTRLGPLTVRATAGDATAEAHAVAVAAPRRTGRVPLVGVGYGGITIAIIALTLAAAATAYGSLDGAALVALAGAVVGYFFVDARGQQAASSDDAGSSAAAGDVGEDQV